MASDLCWTTGIHHFVSESNLRLLDCFVSSLGLRDLSLRRHAIVNNLVDEMRLGKLDCLLRRLCGARFITATVPSKIDSGTRTSTICSSIHFDESFVVVAGVVNVAQRITRFPFLCQVLSVSSPNPSVDVFSENSE